MDIFLFYFLINFFNIAFYFLVFNLIYKCIVEIINFKKKTQKQIKIIKLGGTLFKKITKTERKEGTD